MHPRMNFVIAGSLYSGCLDRRQLNIVPACAVYLYLGSGPYSYSTENSVYSDVKRTQRLKKKKKKRSSLAPAAATQMLPRNSANYHHLLSIPCMRMRLFSELMTSLG